MFFRAAVSIVIFALFALSAGEVRSEPGTGTVSRELRMLTANACAGATKESIDRTLELTEKANMNAIKPGVMSGGALWKTEVALPSPRTRGFDPLGYLIERADERGIEVHPQLSSFILSRPGGIMPGTRRDTYRRFEKRITSPGQREPVPNRACFHDEEYYDFMAAVTRELCENYGIAGIVLDNIRTGDVTCLCEDCVEKYRDKYGRDLVEDSRAPVPEIIEWQAAGVGGLVKAVAETAKGINPEIKVSICAFIGATPGRGGMQGQVPHVWVEEGWVDFIFPMVYTDRGDMEGRKARIGAYQEAMDPSIVYPLLCIINRGDGNIPKEPEVVAEQIETVRKEFNVQGVGLYWSAHLTPEMAEALGEGSFREKAVVPWHK